MAASAERAQALQAKYGKVIAKAWSDTAFKSRLLSNPKAVLIEAGVEVPAGVSVKVVEDTETTRISFFRRHPRANSAKRPSRRW